MWCLSSLVLSLFLVGFVESRVSFEHADVLDTGDLKGVNKVDLHCFSGCRVFSTTKNAKIVIVNSRGTILKSLKELSELVYPNYYELPPGDFYSLENKGTANPSFVLYAVERGAAHYTTGVIYLDATTTAQVTPERGFLVTAISSSGSVQIYDFEGDFSDDLPTVYATGFDSVDEPTCRPVYQARSSVTVRNSYISVNSPIVTLNFKSFNGGKKARLSGGLALASCTSVADSSVVFVSPGYVGCENVTTLYSEVPAISFDSSCTLGNTEGFTVTASGEYSIAKEENALNLTVNDDARRLYGTNHIHQTYLATVLEIDVSWENTRNSDRFALQIDVDSGIVQPTKSSEVDSSVQTTTKSAQLLSVLTSSLVIIPFICSR